MIDCPHADRCPGCSLIRLPERAQLDAKTERLAAALAPYATTGFERIDAIHPALPTSGYRTRAKLAVAEGGRVGLFAADSHEVINIPECRVLAPVLARAASALRGLLAAPPPGTSAVFRGARDESTRLGEDMSGRFRAVDLREVQDDRGAGVLLTLVFEEPRPTPAELDAVCDALERVIPELRVVALSLHDGRSPQLLGRTPLVLRGEPDQRDRNSPDEPWSYASAGSFAQAHRGQAAAISREVLRALSPRAGQRVLDVFAGSGGLGLAIASRGADVTLVESFAPAGEAARRAADGQGLAARVEVRIGAAEDQLPKLCAEGVQFDAAIVNPPRRGVAPAAREALTRLCNAEPASRVCLVYVSCEPETLARDLAHFAQLGLGIVRLVPFDLMPQTREVECVALLERVALPEPTVLYEDEALLAIAKPAFLATVPHRERGDSLLERVRTRLASHAVPLHRLDADTSGVCLFVRQPDAAAEWQAALGHAESRKRYLALVRGQAREKGRIARPIVEDGRARAAVTRYRRRERLGGHTLLEVVPETGRTHQIRKHLASVGRPVLGDERYGHAASNRHLAERHWLDRPFLHCASLELTHPKTGARLHLEAPLPPDLVRVLERLRADGSRPRSSVSGSDPAVRPPRPHSKRTPSRRAKHRRADPR